MMMIILTIKIIIIIIVTIRITIRIIIINDKKITAILSLEFFKTGWI